MNNMVEVTVCVDGKRIAIGLMNVGQALTLADEPSMKVSHPASFPGHSDDLLSQNELASFMRRTGSKKAHHGRETEERQFYESSNGDRWYLAVGDNQQDPYVMHRANLASGGFETRFDIKEFLERDGAKPEGKCLVDMLLHGNEVDTL